MKTPVTKPFKQGKGSVIRFTNEEMDAVITGLAGADEQLVTSMRQRFETALEQSTAEGRAHAEHASVIHPLSQTRLGMRGWHLVSEGSDRIELHVRHGDFLRDGDGWQYGTSGAFDGEPDVLHGRTQACLFSRKAGRWLYVTGEPTGYDEAVAQGMSALKERRKGFRREGDGQDVAFRMWNGVVGKVDVSHFTRHELRHRHTGGEVVGRHYGHDVSLSNGRAIVKTVVGFFETLHNHRWHPTYDVWMIPEMSEHDEAERTGPFWCASAPVWTLSMKGAPDSTLVKTGMPYEPSTRDEAAFKVFATRDEAIAYAASLTRTVWKDARPVIGMIVDVPDVTPRPFATPLDEMTGDMFAVAA